ncbi:MAG: Smr/MutS family protein [Pseudomonadota bacterium]|jgi:DNA-nicking Smr family endonuclease
MKRPLRPEELKLWSLVAGTVRPAPGKAHPTLPNVPPQARAASKDEAKSPTTAKTEAPPKSAPRREPAPPHPIEPGRRRRISRERDPIGRRLDLHGLDQDRAWRALAYFLEDAAADGVRAVLVITGKGAQGDGVLRRRLPDWLSEPPIRPLVAGFSHADRHHGGEGAYYIALKRRPR